MTGYGTFAGTTYQQQVAAFIAAHILAQSRLYWFGSEDDTPAAVSAETGGPGDDLSVALRRDPSTTFEVQAKRGLTGGAKLQETVETIAGKLRAQPISASRVVIAVDESASNTVRLGVKDDLLRLRAGRTDDIKPETTRLLQIAPDMAQLLPRIWIACVDVDEGSAAHTKTALVRLEAALEKPSEAYTAWCLLVQEAGTMCARRLGWMRPRLVQLLSDHGIEVKPPASEERRRLDDCADLLLRFHIPAAKSQLDKLESALSPEVRADPEVHLRLLSLRAKCALLEDDYEAAATFAQRALDRKADHLPALRLATAACMIKGDMGQAAKFVDRALAAGPADPAAWSHHLQIAAATGSSTPQPPAVVAQSSEYRAAEAQVAFNAGDYSRVLDITAELRREGKDTPDALLLRAHVLLVGAAAGPEQLAEVQRICTEVIAELQNEADPRYRRALLLRTGALFESGDRVSAEAEIAQLQRLECDTPEVILNSAILRLDAGDSEAALAILQRPCANKDSALLALRAQLQEHAGRHDTAVRDALAARDALSGSTPVHVKIQIAEALLGVGDRQGCTQLLQDAEILKAEVALRFVLQGRLAFLDGRIPDAIEAFHTAGAAEPKRRREAQFELAERLRTAHMNKEAAEAVAEFKADALPPARLRMLAICLFEAARFAEAQKIVDEQLKGIQAPSWVLGLGFDIARAREDIEGAISLARTLIDRKVGGIDPRLHLAELLFEADRLEESRDEARAVLAQEPLPPLARLQVAILLADLRCWPEALAAAYRSYREARHDPRTHEGLILVSSKVRSEPPAVETVTADTYVRLIHEDTAREYTVLSTNPIDPSQHEISLEDATVLGLVGKRVGEPVEMGSGFGRKTWHVERILAASHRAIQEVFANYESLFPGRNFIQSFPAPVGDSVGDIFPLIQTVEQKKRREEAILRHGTSHGFPLGAMAKALGCTIPAVIAKLSSGDEALGQVVEWQEPTRQETSVRAAAEAAGVVLTRSAIQTAFDLQLHEKLAERYRLLAPRSLLTALIRELREADKLVADGQAGVSAVDSGLTMHHLQAGHPALVTHRDSIAAIVDWCRSRVSFEPRPLEWLDTREAETTLRELIGPDSWDALELAHHRNVPLYADDLGLRRLEHRDSVVSSFSTAPLVVSLASRSALSATERDHRLHDLILRRHLVVPVTPEVLINAVMRGAELRPSELQRVFNVLGALPTISDAALVAAKTFRSIATQTFQVLPLQRIVGLVLNGMLTAWAPPLIVQSVHRAAAEQFWLLPNRFAEIDSVCASFARAHASPPIISPAP